MLRSLAHVTHLMLICPSRLPSTCMVKRTVAAPVRSVCPISKLMKDASRTVSGSPAGLHAPLRVAEPTSVVSLECRHSSALCSSARRKKENRQPREGWEDGTPPPGRHHTGRDFKERGVVR